MLSGTMTDASYHPSYLRDRAEADSVRLPAPQPLGVPVFLHDCVTPLGGETVLSLLMKRMMAERQAPDQDE